MEKIFRWPSVLRPFHFNIDFVLDQLHIRKYFKAIVSADDVDISKPHPETFLKAAALLNTIQKTVSYLKMHPRALKLPGMPACPVSY